MVITLSLFSVAPSPLKAQSVPNRPNIVVIMADDLDTRSVQTMLTLSLMPNLQHYLVTNGTTFSAAFVTNSLCCPSRATFLTGQYAHNHGVRTNFPPDGSVQGLDDRATLATWVQAAGYRTGYVGKYLNFYGWVDLNHDGAVTEADARYVPPGWDDWQALVDPSTYWMYSYWINDNGTLVAYGSNATDYQTDVVAQRTREFIEEADRINDLTPFFLTVMPLAPHVEIDPNAVLTQYADLWRGSLRAAPRHLGTVSAALPTPASWNEGDVSDKPLWIQQKALLTTEDASFVQRQYLQRLTSLRAVDDLIGTTMAALRDTGELSNTVVLFTSDNGYHLGEHRVGDKQTPYEESIRVPLYVRVPGLLAGQVLSQAVLNNDLAPTIAALARATPTLALDGRSFLPLFQTPTRPWRQRFLIEHWSGAGGEPDGWTALQVPTYTAVRTVQAPAVPYQLFVAYQDAPGSQEFYDLQTDPLQLNSLHADATATRRMQRAIHSQWLAALDACGQGRCQTLEFAASTLPPP
jgi:N-acetylglucosamine-6-sulfatase